MNSLKLEQQIRKKLEGEEPQDEVDDYPDPKQSMKAQMRKFDDDADTIPSRIQSSRQSTKLSSSTLTFDDSDGD